ncbi:hypothetical protein [Tychonema sp. LEGE 07203]|uniref:hypothetical protein n=1 Tax=Tychonema sp. LEGE 07203 TaxID=1828671 RepID=UPI00187F5AB9|nr:hypothetical protein [Tychonema sp. LEGE 07203]MBE9093528.1 hypothetical protein [Tychonema sp. LEGE 07203]
MTAICQIPLIAFYGRSGFSAAPSWMQSQSVDRGIQDWCVGSETGFFPDIEGLNRV